MKDALAITIPVSDLWVMIFPALYIFIPDRLDDGLSSSHSVLAHSPGVGPGARETDVTSVEYSKENKRGHTDRGEIHYYVYIAGSALDLDI